jgi:hypothetical protein
MEAMRSFILEDLNWDKIWPGFLVVTVLGVLMVALNVRVINHYD